MNAPYLYRSSIVVKIALAIAILLIVYITSMFFGQMKGLDSSVNSMSAANTRLRELETIMAALTANENSTRSFILTRDSVYLTKRFHTRASLEPRLLKLEKLQPDDKAYHTDTLRKLIDERFAVFHSIRNFGTQRKPPSREELRLTLARGDSLTDHIRDYIYSSTDAEVTHVNQSRINHNYEVETSIITSFLLVTIALFILLVSLNRINSDLNDLKALNDELRFVNYTFNKAEKIAGISHWKYNLRTREYDFSENFYNLLGVDAESFRPSLESILPHIHPDDRGAVVQTYTESILHKTPTSLVFRVLGRNGNIHYVRSISSFAENSDGNLVKIGVNYDITDQYLNTISLEENNKHLKAVNAELESFNNIVSHDLQEPLRKIQMFISRIESSEVDRLSEKGMGFFQRIGDSARRMQNLLIDLVNYSRTMRSEKHFLTVSLQAIVHEVIAKHADSIAEQQATISVDVLPEARVIPFQMEQLFDNLISNSLKFARRNVPLHIRISAVPIAGGERYGDFIPDASKYLKIVVADNGIGFHQEFAERIFHLFRRLERTYEYQGTGIGLAICRKIIENHNGYLFAEGAPNEGAKFIVFLPR